MLFCHVLSRKARAFIHFKTARLMLPHFTWTDYSLAVAVIGIVYYLIVGALFYRQEIKTFFSSQNKLWQRAEKPPPSG